MLSGVIGKFITLCTVISSHQLFTPFFLANWHLKLNESFEIYTCTVSELRGRAEIVVLILGNFNWNLLNQYGNTKVGRAVLVS